ncbi:protein of unknown function [Paraburkholderia kururiensis]
MFGVCTQVHAAAWLARARGAMWAASVAGAAAAVNCRCCLLRRGRDASDSDRGAAEDL